MKQDIYISEWLEKDYKVVYNQLKGALSSLQIPIDVLPYSKDVWCRDYMPVYIGNGQYVGFNFHPDYLWDKPSRREYITKQDLATEDMSIRFSDRMDLIFDGGNYVRCGNKVIMTDKVFSENSNWRPVALLDRMEEAFQAEIVLLPWDMEEPYGHADGMVRYVGDNCVLMTNYLDFDQKYKDDFGSKMKIVLEKAGFRVETIKFWDKLKDDPHFNDLMNESWCYINYLQVGSNVLVPKLSYSPLDEEAKHQIETALGQTVTVKLIDVDMTPIVKDLNSQQNSGGALNCLSWTIKV